MTNGSGHAFPHMHLNGDGLKLEGGLTKREYFAGIAMSGLQAHPTCGQNENGWIVSESVKLADILLAELAKEKTMTPEESGEIQRAKALLRKILGKR